MSGLEPTSLQAATGATIATATLLAGATWSALYPRATVFGPVVWRGPSTRAAVALTFDDGPDVGLTDRIADVLDAHSVRATFFCIGRNLEQCNGLARVLHAAGHQLENHTYSHNTGRDLFSSARLIKDLRRCQDVISDLTGRSPTYYRPAVGIRNPPVHAAARALGLSVVTWTHSARDGVFALTPGRVRALADRASAGSILALHDGQRLGNTARGEQTIRQLPLLLERLKARGFALETLSQLLTP
jgi:peptidoglycan/xylan/chitin deacetylase (PgdA/CDA1 family)